MYSIRATATAVSGRTISRQESVAFSDSAPAAPLPVAVPDAGSSSSSGASTIPRKGSSGGGADLQPYQSCQEDDRPDQSSSSMSSRQNHRPMHATDGGPPAVAEIGVEPLAMNQTSASKNYPLQHETMKRRSLVTSGAAAAAANENGTATSSSNGGGSGSLPIHNGLAARPSRVVRATATPAPLTPTRSTPAFFSVTTPKRRQRLPNQQPTPRVINSPLIDAPPPTTPSQTAPEAGLVHHEDRWRAMSELAGPHRQNPELLDLSNRSLPPEALKFGVPPKVAARVRHLKYDGNSVGKHDLPAFLDLVERLFPRLQHISLKGNPCCPTSPKSIREAHVDSKTTTKKEGKLDAAIAAADRETVRMQRLYLLYRLPDLISIDGDPVSSTERSLARPGSPAGHRVRKEEWLTKAMASVPSVGRVVDCNKEDVSSVGGGSGGGRESVIDSEDGKATCSGSAVEVSICGLVNYVRTEKPEENKTTTVSSPERGKAGEGGQKSGDNSAVFNDDGGDHPSSLKNGLHVVGDKDPDNVGGLQQVRKDVLENSGRGNATTPGRSSKKTVPRGSRPPPSPASKLRAFPAPKQKPGKKISSRRLWRQRKNNVVSMVDAEEDDDDDETDEEDEGEDDEVPEGELEVGEKENGGVHWSGTLETVCSMDNPKPRAIR